MTRQNKLIILICYLVTLSIVMLLYRTNRAKKVKLAKAQLAQVEAGKEKIRKGEAELNRLSLLIPAEADMTSVVEALYGFAKQAGLKQHDLATEGDKSSSTLATRPGRAQEGNSVTTSKIKIILSGTYRQIAEYVRQAQNMERFNRISEIKLTPDESGVKGGITIEFYSLAVKP